MEFLEAPLFDDDIFKMLVQFRIRKINLIEQHASLEIWTNKRT
jgi:hypothetical protein